jgi:hypothetical protein
MDLDKALAGCAGKKYRVRLYFEGLRNERTMGGEARHSSRYWPFE